jgi:phosphoribosylformylglycinamidine synthase
MNTLTLEPRTPSTKREPHTPVLVVRSAGTNCDGETMRALALAGAAPELLHLNELARDPQRLFDYALLVLPGGFSYGDYVAAGRVFGLELRTRIFEPLQRFVADGGYVLGICNGFQILVELGMFDPERKPRALALTDNASNRFECRWVTLETQASAVPFLVLGERMPVPIAHGEGRFVVRDPEVLAELFARRQIVWTYCDPHSKSPSLASADARALPYPLNPNGSLANIAGICDPTGRVLGLMPHPERNLFPWHHPRWTRLGERDEGEGLPFYRKLVEAAHAGRAPSARSSSTKP